MIKKSSMQTEPNGKIPPKRKLIGGDEYHGNSGMKRAIWFVLVGTLIRSDRKPKKDPTKTKGVLMHIHIPNKAKIVKKLTAVAAPAKVRKTFSTMKMLTMDPGNAAAVIMVATFQSVALQNL